MRVILTGGGTGGHIYPAIAIADKIKEMHPEAEIIFVGTSRGLEKALVPQHGYEIRFITVTGFNRKKLLRNVKVLADLARGMSQAKSVLREFRPDFVIGTGGYVCGPLVRAAAKMGIPGYIHEQNAFPGLTNRLLEKHVRKIFLGFAEAGKRFKNPDKTCYTGNPVRGGFLTASKADSRETLGIAKDDFVVLSFGGSQGAARINEVMLEVSATLSGLPGIRVIFVTGRANFEKVQAAVKERGVQLAGNIEMLPYLDRMDLYLSASSVVISRAGALTISEITVCGKPAILVPSPNVTGNHQYYNAKALADAGGASLMEEENFKPEAIIGLLLKMKNNREILSDMSKISKLAYRGDAAEMILKEIEKAQNISADRSKERNIKAPLT